MKRLTFFIALSILCSCSLTAQWVQTNGPDWVTSFLSSETFVYVASNQNGVARSSDDGASWTYVNSGLTDSYVTCLAARGATLITGGGAGIGKVFLSTNLGDSWTAATALSRPITALVVSGTTLFAGTNSIGIYSSTNDGGDWTAVNTGLADSIIFALAVVDTNLFAGTPTGGVFVSTNNGTSWTAVNQGLPRFEGDSSRYYPIQCLRASGQSLFAGTKGLFLSTNNGTAWTYVGLGQYDVMDLVTTGANVFAVADSGISSHFLFLSTNNGATWTDAGSDLLFPEAIWITNTQSLVGVYGVGLWRRPLSEMINNTQIPNAGFEDWRTVGNCIEPTSWYSFYSLFDSSGTYSPITRSTDHYPENSGSYSVRISNDTSLWNSGTPPSSVLGWGMLLSNKLDDRPLFPVSGHPTSLRGYYKFLSENGDTMNINVHFYYNGTEVTGGRFQSDVTASSWTPFQVFVSDTSYTNVDSARITLSASNEPKDGSKGPLGNSVLYIDNLSFDTLITSVPLVTHAVPTAFLLYQNYPNPFNPTTTISYQLPTQSHVMLKIFDVLGREMTTLVNEVKQPGEYTATWNAEKVPSGVYFYRLMAKAIPSGQAGNYVETKKLLLLR